MIPLLIAGTVVGFILWGVESSTPDSTAGVKDLGGRVASVPANETLVVVHSIAKAHEVMQITYDGEKTVSFDCISWTCVDPEPAHLCGVGCEVAVHAGVFVGDFYVTQRSDKTVTVEWQWGWDFRPPKS